MRKYVYFFRGDLRTHVDIYKSRVDAAEKNIKIQMVTGLSITEGFRQRSLVEHYREKGVSIFIVPRPLTDLFFLLYFIIQAVGSEKVVVHLRKGTRRPIEWASKIFRNRYSLITEIEGDSVSEIEYLREHPYCEGFYEKICKDLASVHARQELAINNSDGIFVVTNELKNLLIKRYAKKSVSSDKFLVLPTGFDSTKFFFDPQLREQKRRELGIDGRFTFIFTGNVYYSWQNIKASIDIFELVKFKNIAPSPFFIFLVRKADHEIALNFIRRAALTESDFLLKTVPHDNVNGYLNAADMGVLLRDNHTMNMVASPGKMGEYLAAGLNILTTPYMGTYSKPLAENNIGILIDDFRNLKNVEPSLREHLKKGNRQQISDWARENFSSSRYADQYVRFLKEI